MGDEQNSIDIIFDSQTDSHIEELIHKRIDELEREGYRIVGAEPIEQIVIKIVGRRFYLEKG